MGKDKKNKSKVEQVKKDPFGALSHLIDLYSENRDSYDLKTLTDLRENISLTLFYAADEASEFIANSDAKDYERKRAYAEREAYYRSPEGGKKTIASSENLARIDCKEQDEACVVALREKERTRIILSSVNQILNALSSRINTTEKK